MGKKSKKERIQPTDTTTEIDNVIDEPPKIVAEGIQSNPIKKNKKPKKTFSRIQFDPTKNYSTPGARESWGQNVKGKVFRKEKGKKKRCPAANIKIDGSVRSTKFN